MNFKFPRQIVFVILVLCIAWTRPHQKQEIESAMNQYNHYIIMMNTDSIASIFSTDGDLGGIAHGRDSIKHFLLRFKEFKVLSQTSSTNMISITGDSALQTGLYWQTTIVPPADTMHVKGSFTARWIFEEVSGWKIKRMDTQPLQ
jgi:hypothetical protein